nr:hypothetical protein [Streptomyces sp. PRh5]
MSERKPYETDLSGEHWALIEPVIAVWKAAHPSVSGHQGRYEMREIVNAAGIALLDKVAADTDTVQKAPDSSADGRSS